VRLDSAVRAGQACPQRRIGVGHRDEPTDVARGERGQVAPHVVVVEPDHSNSELCGHGVVLEG
jgi:hypothetical protein